MSSRVTGAVTRALFVGRSGGRRAFGRTQAAVERAVDLFEFGLGDALLRVYSLLDGRTRLGELAAKVRSPEARLNLLRLTYLLVQTDLARLS